MIGISKNRDKIINKLERNMESFLKNVMTRGVKEEIAEKILTKNFDRFLAAFTSREVDREQNYEFFEQLGDLTINKFIVTYMTRRFPQLRSSDGVGILASLRILYGSKKTLSELCSRFGFDKHVRMSREENLDVQKFRDVLEDVFEAFFGAFEYSLEEIVPGMGYLGCYRVLKSMFDELDVSIDYESLVDAKTRLNELKDEYKFNVRYVDIKRDDNMFFTELYVNNTLAGTGLSNFKKESQISAAETALGWIFKNMNIKKEAPERYRKIANKLW